MINHELNAKSHAKKQKLRHFKDIMATIVVVLGGISVIIAISLIFLYLLFEVKPLFDQAKITEKIEYKLPTSNDILYVAVEDRLEVANWVNSDGQVYFFNTHTSKIIRIEKLKIPENTKITSFYKSEPARGISDEDEKKHSKEITFFGLDDGTVLIARHYFDVSYNQAGKRQIQAKIDYPFGDKAILINKQQAINHISAEWDENGITIVTQDNSKQLTLTYLEKETSLDEEDVNYTQSQKVIAQSPADNIKFLLVNKPQTYLYVINKKNALSFYNISNKQQPELLEHIPSLNKKATNITDAKLLIGGISLLIATADGQISQWMPVQTENNGQTTSTNLKLINIRNFKLGESAIVSIATEYRRKGFIAINAKGELGIFHTTAERTLIKRSISDKPLNKIYLSPRADAALIQTADNSIVFLKIKNNHPEVSWSSLWQKNMYESYKEPAYIWQSSSSTDDFEPKYSLVPLTFGTLKAAFYAMLISIPLAIMGAIFTAHFMAPSMRKLVKPGIEIMEALPTVIIGFLAGIWLAPLISDNLAAVFLILITLPLGILLSSYAWQKTPVHYRQWIPDGWEPAILIPIVIIIAWITFGLIGPGLEKLFFGGSLVHWMETRENPITYDQRNAIVVGIAMGFAVIPTIFSIAEDAIFAVPKHLTQGSLALGATQWQTLWRVVLLTASPGIFSAIMIGFGRAIGETMIVLMATGNTPIMETSIFQGLRTLSANIAVELPESAQHSTHFRILFLAALVLFIFTFIFNTIAEIVRQRLRTKYSTL